MALGLRSRPSSGSAFVYTKISARGRGRDFIYKKNVARPRFALSTQRIPRGRGPIISTPTFYGDCINTNLVSRMGDEVNTTSALRALVLQGLGAMLRYLERNFTGAIVMKRSIFEESHHLRPDIPNEISGGRS